MVDVNNLNNVFLINGFLQKLDFERDLHMIILAYLIWNYFPFETAKERIINWWYPPIGKKCHGRKNMVTFQFIEHDDGDYTKRSDRYLAVMEKIRKEADIYQTKSIDQRRCGETVSIYETSQENDFLIDKEKEIYGHMEKDDKENGNSIRTEVTLQIYSYKTNHNGIVEWVENATREWKQQWEGVLRRGDLKYVIEITGTKDDVTWVRYPYKATATFENTFFPGKELLIKELNQFRDGEKEWKSRGWPWQFGVALTGTRGTGKTRILKCIAHHMKRHLYVIKMNDLFKVDKLIKVMNGLAGSVSLLPSEFIVIFEEIADQTSMIGSRDDENEEKHEAVVKMKGADGEDIINTMSGNYELQRRRQFLGEFLPAIDGINERYGGMIIMTTNYVERLDKALIRPGRIDYHLHMEGGYDRMSTFQVLHNFWKEKMDNYTPDDIVDDAVDRYTGAELIKFCRVHAEDFTKIEEIFFKEEGDKEGLTAGWGSFS